MAKVKEPSTRQWYMQAAVEHGWSRTTLVMQIASAAHQRQGITTSNFVERLPAPASELVHQALKDPYIFDFLTLAEDFHERELETGLLTHVEKFLLELGQGFAFVGRQVRLEVGDEDYPIDLLFYHLKLRRYVVIELKARAFTPGDVGQLNLYLSAVDDLLRHPDDQPTIGLLLCRKKNKLVAEYALRGLDQSIAVAEWQTRLTHSLPADLRGSLPTIEEIEAELSGDFTNETEGES
jgi:predicted nuclease of restriction endonuclease-like (RecB) superfamily